LILPICKESKQAHSAPGWQCAKPTGFEPAQGGTKASQAQNFAVNHTTSTLFWLAQPAHSRLFVPAQQKPVLRSSPA